MADILSKFKPVEMDLHNMIRGILIMDAADCGAPYFLREPADIWFDPNGTGAVVTDLAWRRDGKTYGADVHTHHARGAQPLHSRIASMDNKKRSGTGSIEAHRRAANIAAAAEEAAAAARRAHQSNHRELAEIAQAKRHTLNNVYLPGYDTCAAGAGDTFFPAGFSEFAGYSDSAKELLKQIQHTGDSLEHDEEGDRFDGGAAASWATRAHRAFF